MLTNSLHPNYFGLFLMTLGVSMSVKSNLGVSPVSSIPYIITCITGLEMGKATIVFHVFLVVLQILILRKAFRKKHLLQVVVGVIFGYFTTFSNYLFSFISRQILFRLREKGQCSRFLTLQRSYLKK